MLYKNQIYIEFWTTFVIKCQLFEQKQVFVKIVQKWPISTKKISKISNVEIFLIKYKMLRMHDFHS